MTRHSSSSSIIIEGVKPNESPDLNTVWIAIGYPNTSVSIPLWVRGGENIPTLLQYDSQIQNSPLNKMALNWKSTCYPLTRSDGYHYLKLDELVNKDNNGYIQLIEPIEKEIFDETDNRLIKWHNQTPSISEIEIYYKWLNNKIVNFYSSQENKP